MPIGSLNHATKVKGWSMSRGEDVCSTPAAAPCLTKAHRELKKCMHELGLRNDYRGATPLLSLQIWARTIDVKYQLLLFHAQCPLS